VNVALDHVVLVVPELEPAVRAFGAAGFVVTPGGRHDAIPTRNALIAFADGAYLELLAPRDAETREALLLRSRRPGFAAELRRSSAIGRRFLPSLAGPAGVADFVLRANHLERAARELRQRGFAAAGPVAMSRERDDGVRLEWRLLLPADHRLPFFIEDITPRERRVPAAPEALAHPNGATGVDGVRVVAEEVVPLALAYADLFAARPEVDGGGATRLDLPGVRVILDPGEPPGARGVTLRGTGALPEAVEALGVRGA
jgi:hypothetical protein